MKQIDAKGLACPAPVIQTKAVIEEESPESIDVMVDNEAASQNVSRFLQSRHYKIAVQKQGNEFHVLGQKEPDHIHESVPQPQPKPDHQKILVMIGSDKIGNGDDVLGEKLMISFLKTLKEMGSDLWRLVFVNNGVKLTIDQSLVLEDLKHLEKTGTHILVCGTCLTHFNLLEQKEVGQTTNMLDIVTSMQLADRVINL
ncbi:MAG: sulfurtransferase-like selenium metabolism protein YedF [Deltaproteobacteria bacterium]|nr:MAG: sulfurtransferase-like selenium metabolism protein YedF [Deltaproteobacteria bacterium]